MKDLLSPKFYFFNFFISPNDSIELAEKMHPIAGNDLLVRLKNLFDSYDFSSIKKKTARISEGIEIHYLWCDCVNAFIEFMRKELKVSCSTSYHDAMKYFVNRIFLHSLAKMEVILHQNRINLRNKSSIRENLH